MTRLFWTVDRSFHHEIDLWTTDYWGTGKPPRIYVFGTALSQKSTVEVFSEEQAVDFKLRFPDAILGGPYR